MLKLPPWLAYMLVVVVTIAWLVNIFAQLAVHGYKPDPGVNYLFGAIVGTLILGRKKDDRNEDE